MAFYTGDRTYDTILTISLCCALLVPIGSHFVPSPYGRFSSERFGPRINARLGWFVMELPATFGFLFFYLAGPRRREWVPLVLAAMWLIHYANRGFLFPLLMRTPRGERSTFSLSINFNSP